MEPQRKVSRALFDIKPRRQSDDFDVPFEARLSSHVDLRSKPMGIKVPAEVPVTSQEPSAQAPVASPSVTLHEILASAPVASTREILAREIEAELSSKIVAKESAIEAPAVPIVELPDVPPTTEEQQTELERFWNKKAEVSAPVMDVSAPATLASVVPMPVQVPIAHLSPAAKEVEIWAQRFKESHHGQGSIPLFKNKRSRGWRHRTAMFLTFVVMLGAGSMGVAALARGGLFVRQNVIENGHNAVANLEDAKQNLEAFDFSKAADNFALAADDFGKASGTLSDLGASLASFLGNFPGFHKVKAADNIAKAGKLVAQSGESLSRAFSNLQRVNFFAMIRVDPNSSSQSIAKPLSDFRDVLSYANKNIRTAQALLSDVKDDAIPSDKQELFETFKDKIPTLQSYIGDAVHYADFLLQLIGQNKNRSYLVLLENNTELRPTGGFPGTYALVSFDQGAIKKVFIDDVYNIDGQIKENIIPPRPLQHITPSWGMRDANWFADFPTSARKIEEMYKRDGGGAVDGVVAINPSIIAQLLEITGPVAMPEYGKTLDSHNFLAEIQDEVEYKADRAQPKKILFDFQPKFFAALAQLPKDKWMSVFKIGLESIAQKHILASFNDPDLEQTAIDNGFSGQLSTTDGDYLEVSFSNVKGGKADAVTENTMKLTTELNDTRGIVHALTIKRTHTGGSSPYAFYNKENPSYVKVYLPKGTVFDSINGQQDPNFKPLVSYADLGFKADPDLAALEQSTTNPKSGVDVFTESDRTVIGFWMITKPGKTISVDLSYHVPYDAIRLPKRQYSLVWQKQAGTFSDQIQYNFKIPSGLTVAGHSPELQELGDTLVLTSDLSTDRELQVVLN